MGGLYGVIHVTHNKLRGTYYMSRKSQVEKFYARESKKAVDTQVIKEAEVKRQVKDETIERVAERQMKRFGMTAEDIFAVFGREHIGPFIKMWNNSIDDHIAQTTKPILDEVQALRKENQELRQQITELPDMITDVLALAMQGIMKGIGESLMVPQQAESVEVEWDSITGGESELSKVSYIIDIDRLLDNNELVRLPNEIYVWDELDKLIRFYYEEGVDVIKGTHFKKQSSRTNGLYQSFMREYAGQKGAWKSHVLMVIKTVSK